MYVFFSELMPVETELKLSLPLKHSNRLLRLPLLKSLRTSRPSTHNLYSIYYDTPNLDLKNHGIALRLRRIGRRWIQTVKGHGHILAGLFRHREFEVLVKGAKPDYTKITDPCFQKLFDDSAFIQQIQPVFFTQFTRNIRVLHIEDGSEIEFCLDRGKILTNSLSMPLCEIELELKSGNASQLFQFALSLQNVFTFPLKLENASKAERGYTLSSGKIKPPVKASRTTLNTEMRTELAFNIIFCNCLEHLSSNECGMLKEDDIEYLHQMRLALRRERFALKLFSEAFPGEAAASLKRELKWLTAKFDPALDWDIFVVSSLKAIQNVYPDHAGVNMLMKTCKKLSNLNRKTARRAVQSKRYLKLMLKLGAWLSAESLSCRLESINTSELTNASIGKFASTLLNKQHQQLKTYGETLTRINVSDLHSLRIITKNQCYAVEFFAGLYPNNDTSQYLRSLYKLQDILGSINSSVVIKKLFSEMKINKRKQVQNEAIGILLGWTMQHSFQKKLVLNRTWISFNKINPFWGKEITNIFS